MRFDFPVHHGYILKESESATSDTDFIVWLATENKTYPICSYFDKDQNCVMFVLTNGPVLRALYDEYEDKCEPLRRHSRNVRDLVRYCKMVKSNYQEKNHGK